LELHEEIIKKNNNNNTAQEFSTINKGPKPRKVLPSVWKCSLGEILQANTRLSVVVRRILLEERKRIEEEKKKKAEEDNIIKAAQLKEEEEKRKEEVKRKEDNKRFGLNEDGTSVEKPPLIPEPVSKTKQRRDKRKQNHVEREKAINPEEDEPVVDNMIPPISGRPEAEITHEIEKIQQLHDSGFMNDFEFDNRMLELNEELVPYIKTEPIFPTIEIKREDDEKPEDMNVESEEIVNNIQSTYTESEGDVLSNTLDNELLQYVSNGGGITLATFIATLNSTNRKTNSKKKICSSYC